VFSGNLTESGMPILANDPHVGLGNPSMWYLVDVRVKRFAHQAGATVPGIPAVIMGRSKWLAWGATSSKQDAIDLFHHRIFSNNTYLFDNQLLPMKVLRESIGVRLYPYTIDIDVKWTNSGPLMESWGKLVGTVNPFWPSNPENVGALSFNHVLYHIKDTTWIGLYSAWTAKSVQEF
jgi:penicillin amidase